MNETLNREKRYAMCVFLHRKILDEQAESQKYARLAADAAAVPGLNSVLAGLERAQKSEITNLERLYGALCKDMDYV